MMSKERMVQVTKEEYENLIRDQHTVELLRDYIRQDWQSDPMICLLLGLQGPDNHPVMNPNLKKNFRKAEEPEEMRTTEVLNKAAEVAAKMTAEDRLESPPEEPEKEEPEKKSGRKKIDRGKVMALHNAGWTNKKIADEMACSEWSVSMILKELSEEK